MVQKIASAITLGVVALNVASGLALPVGPGMDDRTSVVRRDRGVATNLHARAVGSSWVDKNLLARREKTAAAAANAPKSSSTPTSSNDSDMEDMEGNDDDALDDDSDEIGFENDISAEPQRGTDTKQGGKGESMIGHTLAEKPLSRRDVPLTTNVLLKRGSGKTSNLNAEAEAPSSINKNLDVEKTESAAASKLPSSSTSKSSDPLDDAGALSKTDEEDGDSEGDELDLGGDDALSSSSLDLPATGSKGSKKLTAERTGGNGSSKDLSRRFLTQDQMQTGVNILGDMVSKKLGAAATPAATPSAVPSANPDVPPHSHGAISETGGKTASKSDSDDLIGTDEPKSGKPALAHTSDDDLDFEGGVTKHGKGEFSSEDEEDI